MERYVSKFNNLGLFVLLFTSSLPAVTVSTAQYGNTRLGVNSTETTLTPANVATLVTLGTYVLDGAIYVQPLYIPSLTISSHVYNVVFVGTMNNSVYALDADNPGSAPLWKTNFGSPATIYTTDVRFYGGPVGIVATPVIDVSGNFIYVVTASNTAYTLRKIALLTGVQSTSVDITGSVTGTGAGSSGGSVPFDNTKHLNRTPLTLANGNVYVAFASGQAENGNNWHGWLFAYSIATLAKVATLNTTPNGYGGGIWHAGGGLVVDGNGDLYFLTGNGDWNGTTNFSQSLVRVNSSLVIQDWFTPSNESDTSGVDADLASGHLMLLTSTLLSFGSKDGRIWVVLSTSMGHLQGTGTAPQVFNAATVTATNSSGVYGGAFFQSTGFFPVNGQPTFAFTFSGSTYTTTALASTPGSYSQVMLAGSSNAGSNSILWGLTISAGAYSVQRSVVLHAVNPTTLSDYYSSGSLGNYAKFADPLIANGRVYIPTSDGVIPVLGLPSAVVATSVTGVAVAGP